MLKRGISSVFFILLLAGLFFHGGEAHAASYVSPKQVYTYEEMIEDIKELAAAYPDLISYKIVGKSEYGRDLYAVSIGTGKPTVFINGSHHAREWMTTNLNMYMIDQYASAYKNNSKINGYNAKSILDSTTIWFIPMLNPDGVTLQQSGLKAFPKSDHAKLLKMNGGSNNFKRWKANGKGVDLNRQYDAGWGSGGPKSPSFKNYKGTKPHSSKEVAAIINFTYEINPEMTISYHSSGQILYWKYNQTGAQLTRDYAYAKQLSRMTGYSLVNPNGVPDGGGYKDWFVKTFKRPGFTPEISRYYTETSPPLSEWDGVWKENKAVGLYAAQEGAKLYDSRYKEVVRREASKVANVVKQAKGLRPYYTIDSLEDIAVSKEMTDKYNALGRELGKIENSIEGLRVEDRDKLKRALKEAVEIKGNAARFIDAVKSAKSLDEQIIVFDEAVERGILDASVVQQYDQFSYQIKKSEKVISKVYGSLPRSLFSEKYLNPAKIMKESVIFEISRYNLLTEMNALLDRKELEFFSAKIEVLAQLEENSRSIKEKGNILHPGSYPEHPAYEETLKKMKDNVMVRYQSMTQPEPEEPVEGGGN